MLLERLTDTPSDHAHARREIAAVHRAWVSRADEALALGAHDRRSPSALPHTLIHGDFHPGNVVGGTIIDWSDAAVANPLHDVNHYLLNRDESERAPLLDAYAKAWPEYDIHAEAAACEAETYEYIAESYAGITEACADDDCWWFAGEESRWLERAEAVRAGRRPDADA
jgi:aminoglycoside phosphotransferase (APT) family kinase protein